jgi:cell division protein FtsN
MNRSLQRQRGSTLLGLIAGLVLGLLIAVGIAVYLTNAPIPFVNKVQRPTENVKPGADGKLPDPNQPLYGAPPNPPPPPTKGDIPRVEPPSETKAMAEKAAEKSQADEGTRFLLQAGAFRTPEDADGMRARLALLGLDARVYPVDQGGTPLYRVRLGPYGLIDDVNRVRKILAENGVEANVIRVR